MNHFIGIFLLVREFWTSQSIGSHSRFVIHRYRVQISERLLEIPSNRLRFSPVPPRSWRDITSHYITVPRTSQITVYKWTGQLKLHCVIYWKWRYMKRYKYLWVVNTEALRREDIRGNGSIIPAFKTNRWWINSVALSPRANYTDWATATCRRNLVSTFVDRGVSRGQRGRSLTVVNLSFLDRSRYFSFK
jgi:hypothetical protein